MSWLRESLYSLLSRLPHISRSASTKESFVDKGICAACGGACCKSMPGTAMPEDFGSPGELRQNLKEALATGNWAVDWWEGDPTGGDRIHTYYVRPATKDKAGIRILDPSRGGVCVFHTSAGCSIFDNRPSGCRGLKPNKDRSPIGGLFCSVEHSSKKASAIAWHPYNGILYELASAQEEMV